MTKLGELELRAENERLKASLCTITTHAAVLFQTTGAAIAMLQNMLPIIATLDASAAKSGEKAVASFQEYIASIQAIEEAARIQNAPTSEAKN